MFGKKQKEIKKLLIRNLLNKVQEHAKFINNTVEFIKNFGNMTKRKNHKLKLADFTKAKNNLVGLSMSLCVANYIFYKHKRIYKKYNNLMAQVQRQLEIDLEEMRGKDELRKQVKNLYKNAPSKGKADL